MNAFFAEHWWDLASVVGFLITIVIIWMTKAASEAARDAAQSTKDQMASLETVMDLSSAMTAMEEIKRLHRAHAWAILPDRYTLLRKYLVSVQATRRDLTDSQKGSLGAAIAQFRRMEEEVERAQRNQEQDLVDVVRLNSIVSSQLDALQGLLATLKKQGV